MKAEWLIQPGWPVLRWGESASALAASLTADHEWVPLLNPEDQFVQLLNRQQLQALDGQDPASLPLPNRQPVVFYGAHVFEVWRVLAETGAEVVVALDPDGYYMGIISRRAAFEVPAQWLSTLEPGCVLALDVPKRTYSLAEMAHIVEQNNLRVVASYLQALPDSELVRVHLKLNTTDSPAVVSALERYGYTVAAVYLPQQISDDVQEHYKALMRFLNV